MPTAAFPPRSDCRRLLRGRFLLALACWLAAPALAGATPEGLGLLTLLDIQGLRLLRVDAARAPDSLRQAEVLVCGGGLAGLAATLALCEAGHTVLLSEETDWLGGQITAQGMSALDEPTLVERCGGTRSYQTLREGIRDYYRREGRLLPAAAASPALNPGNCWVSRLAFEPRAALAVIAERLAPYEQGGQLVVLTRHKPLRAERAGRRVLSVDLLDLERQTILRVEAALIIEATDLGELLPLCGVDFVRGAEARSETGEPNAPEIADPDCVQAFTYPFILEARPGESHVIGEPPDYARNRRQQPYSPRVTLPDDKGGQRYALLRLYEKTPNLAGSFWSYRRLIDCTLFEPDAFRSDLTLINWPAMDYRDGHLLAEDQATVLSHLEAARRLSLGFLYWLQTALTHRGGRGHPELLLNREALGTADGLARFPYIREGRRARTRERLAEQDLAERCNQGRTRGRFFADAIGVGQYAIDIHAGPCRSAAFTQPALPFQLPLGLLVTHDTDNLIPAGKPCGTTHIANGATRVHAVEWSLGEAAGTLAALCLESGLSPTDIHAGLGLTRQLQRRLVERGAPIYWYRDLSPADPDFVTAQLAPFASDSARAVAEGSLDYRRP